MDFESVSEKKKSDGTVGTGRPVCRYVLLKCLRYIAADELMLFGLLNGALAESVIALILALAGCMHFHIKQVFNKLTQFTVTHSHCSHLYITSS